MRLIDDFSGSQPLLHQSCFPIIAFPCRLRRSRRPSCSPVRPSRVCLKMRKSRCSKSITVCHNPFYFLWIGHSAYVLCPNNSEILPPLSASGLAAGSIHQTLFAAYGRLHFLCALVSSSGDYMIHRGRNSGCGRILRLTPVTGAISSTFPEPISSDAWLSDSKPLDGP